jgi:hypothetical protein
MSFSPDVAFRSAGVAGGVRHHKSGAALLIQRAVEQLHPQVIRVVGGRDAQRVARIAFELVVVHTIHVEGRISHHEVKAASGAVQVLIVGVGGPHVAFQPMHGQVHLAQAHGLGDALLPVDAKVGRGAAGGA